MIRRIIHIDKEKCNGCGLCAEACHENAIAIVDGKAALIKDDYCDGLGDCLPSCPAGAISFETREAAPYDEAAVKAHTGSLRSDAGSQGDKKPQGAPGLQIAEKPQSAKLGNWPIQLKLAPVKASCFDRAELLIAADCTAYAYADFHDDFIAGRTTLIGCPKLDGVDYSQKLGEIIAGNNVEGITVTRMEVPCCGGLENAVRKAVSISGKDIPFGVVTIAADGRIIRTKN